MHSQQDLARVEASFDEQHLLPAAGLLPAATLGQCLNLAGLVDQRLGLAREAANSGTKALTVIGSILAGGDSIDDTDVMRAGATRELFTQVRAPSTIGTWLRAFKWSNVRELDAVSRELPARLWDAGAGPADPSGPLTFDLDSTIVPVYRRGKQGADYGYTKVRGYHPQVATLAETGQVLLSRMRGGAAGSARKAKSFLTETIGRLRHAGASGPLTVRADSASYSRAVIITAHKLGVRFSVTARQDPKIRATLFTTWDYHAFVTDRDGELPEIEADHRHHAVVEQSIAELKSAGLAHAPSGRFFANAAWLALSVMAHNLARAVGSLTGTDLARATVPTPAAQAVHRPWPTRALRTASAPPYPVAGPGRTRS